MGKNLSLEEILSALPDGGLFRESASWQFSPRPLALSPHFVRSLEGLGFVLAKFQEACERLYFLSLKGNAPSWIAQLLDAGKPSWLIELQRSRIWQGKYSNLIRPDLLLMNSGYAISEIDSVPGGMGITAWLSHLYGSEGWDILGGKDGMLDGFCELFPDGVDILVSRESGDYRSEIEWFCQELNKKFDSIGEKYRCCDAENYRPVKMGNLWKPIYRFFELFDIDEIPGAQKLCQSEELTILSPPKFLHEEKLWLALFHTPSLRKYWKSLMRGSHFERLQQIIPRGWVLDPSPISYHAALPGLYAHDWADVAEFPQKARQFAVKISGFDPRGWGGRGVFIGHDLSQNEWKGVIEAGLADFANKPWIMQEFVKTQVIEHPKFDSESGEILTMQGRVRLCPWYKRNENGVKLIGALATVAPADKKKIHGMKDSILLPVVIEKEN